MTEDDVEDLHSHIRVYIKKHVHVSGGVNNRMYYLKRFLKFAGKFAVDSAAGTDVPLESSDPERRCKVNTFSSSSDDCNDENEEKEQDSDDDDPL